MDDNILKVLCEFNSVYFFFEATKGDTYIEFDSKNQSYAITISNKFLYYNGIYRGDAIEMISKYANQYIEKNPSDITSNGFYKFLMVADRNHKIEQILANP